MKALPLYISLQLLMMSVSMNAQKQLFSLGLGWNLGKQMDAYVNGVANETSWGNGSRGAGRECSGIIEHATGTPIGNGAAIVKVMMDGYSEGKRDSVIVQ